MPVTMLAHLPVPESWRHPSLRRNVVMNWVSTLANVGLSFLMIPLVVRTLDKELYGVWSFLNGIAAYSNLIYLGLGAAFMKYFSEAVGRRDVAQLNRLLGIACTLYSCLGAVCVIIALSISPFIPTAFAQPLTGAVAGATQAATVLLGLRVMCFFVASAFSALLASHGRMDLVAATTTFTAILRTLAVVVAIRYKEPLVALAIVMVAEAALQIGIMAALGRLITPDVRVRWLWPTALELRSLYGFGFQAFFVQLAVMLIGYTDTALIGFFLGAGSVTLYALPLQLVEYSRLLINGVTLALLPELSASRARGDHARLTEIYLRAARVCACLAMFIGIHLIILGPAFLRIWVGEAFAVSSPAVLVFLSIAAFASALSTQVLAPFYQALDMLRVLVAILLGEALLNVALSIWLAQVVGLAGVALATALPACLITMVLAPRYMLPLLGVGWREFATAVLLPATGVLVASVVAQTVMSIWGEPTSYLRLVLRTVASAIASLPVIVVGFPRQEWLPLVRRFGRLGVRSV